VIIRSNHVFGLLLVDDKNDKLCVATDFEPLLMTNQYQAELLEKVSRTFALTIPQLPSPLSDWVSNAYLLCRIADTIEDEPVLDCDTKSTLILRFLDVLSGQYASTDFSESVTSKLSDATPEAEHELLSQTPAVIAEYQQFPAQVQHILARCVTIMSEGMTHYQHVASPDGLADQAALDKYCYVVAGVVGEMLTELFIAYRPSLAAHQQDLKALSVSFGLGLQLTNILKDVWDDARRDVCWWPQSILKQRICCPPQEKQSFLETKTQLLSVAQGHLCDALDYTLLLPTEEQGIRQFCLWALGMATQTLRVIQSSPDYLNGSTVKISRKTVKQVIITSRLLGRSNWGLRCLFRWWSRGLKCQRRSYHELYRTVSCW